MTETEPIVFIVDDDDSVRKSLARLITSVGLKVETFSSANAFLKRDAYDGPACLVLDIRMPGLSGLELQTELAKAERTLSIVFITSIYQPPFRIIPYTHYKTAKRLCDNRIANTKARKAREVAVGCPQLFHPLQFTQSGNPGIVDLPTGNMPGFDKPAKLRPVTL